MEHREIARRLSTLVQLDIDAAHAYGRAIAAVEPPAIRRELEAFRDDHERHIKDLSAEVRRLGGSPPPYARDMKGRVIETFTAARSFTGTLGALRAMRMNEQMTQATYARARQWPLPAEARALVERNYADERRHLAAIRDALRRRSWEQTGGLRLVDAYAHPATAVPLAIGGALILYGAVRRSWFGALGAAFALGALVLAQEVRSGAAARRAASHGGWRGQRRIPVQPLAGWGHGAFRLPEAEAALPAR